MRGEFEFADHGDAAADEVLDEGDGGIDSWAKDGELVGALGACLFGVGACEEADPLFGEGLDFLSEERFFCGIKDRDHGALLVKQLGGGGTTFAGPENGDGLIMVERIHRSLRVAKPSNENMMERIQKRTITVFSFHPLSSKW